MGASVSRIMHSGHSRAELMRIVRICMQQEQRGGDATALHAAMPKHARLCVLGPTLCALWIAGLHPKVPKKKHFALS